jgi:hypothetical protein
LRMDMGEDIGQDEAENELTRIIGAEMKHSE